MVAALISARSGTRADDGGPVSPDGPRRGSCFQESVPLVALLEGARQEMACFQRRQQAANVCAFELFRRALVLRDEAAWVGLYDLYAHLIESWILHSAHASFLENLDALVNETFAKFAHALTGRDLRAFATTPALLAYLKRCAASVVADDQRQRQQWSREERLSALEREPQVADPADAIAGQQAARDLWRAMSREVSCEAERLLLESCVQGVQPRDLASRYPDLFPTIDAVYDTKRNLLERLRRSRAVQAWRREQGCAEETLPPLKTRGRPRKPPSPAALPKGDSL